MSSIADFYRRQQGSPEPAGPDPVPLPPAGDVHDAGAFRMELPQGWRDHTMHLFVGPVEDGVQHTVTVVIDREGVGALDEYTDAQVKAMEATLKGFAVVRRESMATITGVPASRAVFEWHPAEDRTIVQELVCVVKDGRGYRLAATFSPTTFETQGPAVRGMLLGFVPA